MIDDRNFKDRAKGTMLTALAGPVSNILLAIFLTIVLKILLVTGLLSVTTTNQIVGLLVNMLMITIQFNVIFGIFNMIPLPPFDGSKVLFYFLPQRFRGIMYTLERYSFIIILVIFCTNIASFVISPAYSLILKFLNFILGL